MPILFKKNATAKHNKLYLLYGPCQPSIPENIFDDIKLQTLAVPTCEPKLFFSITKIS
jgi:tRNA(Leu) C34 or U34 (ribose-2'-O)-methylase TrmL